MPMSTYMKELRELVGTRQLLIPSVAAIIRDGDTILLQKRADDGEWSMPAGAIDPGESPQEAIVREVYEETGLHVTPLKIAGVFGGTKFRHTYPNGDMLEYTIVVFECGIISGELACVDGESLELQYWPADAMPRLVLPYPAELFTCRLLSS